MFEEHSLVDRKSSETAKLITVQDGWRLSISSTVSIATGNLEGMMTVNKW